MPVRKSRDPEFRCEGTGLHLLGRRADRDGPRTGGADLLRNGPAYYDAESGLHYNYFRDYEPDTGRYVESDPIGLRAGPSTYGYALGNSLRWFDPLGLKVRLC